MSSHSRLGKGLGSLFPTLQQDQVKQKQDSLFPAIPQAQASDVSRETSDEAKAVGNATVQKIAEQSAFVPVAGSAEARPADVSRETSVKEPLENERGGAGGTHGVSSSVSRETSGAAGRNVSEKTHQKSSRPKIPSLTDSLHPADLFFALDDAPAVHRSTRKGSAAEGPAQSDAGTRMHDGDETAASSHQDDGASANGETSSSKSAQTESASEGDRSASPAGGEFTVLDGAYYTVLPVSDIAPNEHQPRTIFDEDELRELADSIKEVGVLEPIVVRKREGWIAPYELVMGERRLRAARMAGLDSIPALIRTTTDENMLRDAVLENLHRVALNPLEEAAAYQQMIDDFHVTQAQLAQSVSKSRSQITNTLRLLQLPAAVQKKVAAGVLSAGHARALLALTDPKQMEQLANRIIAEGLSVRSTEEIVAMKNGAETKQRRHPQPSVWQGSDELKRLENRFETKVDIRGTRKKGKIEITFSSEEDLARIMNLIGAAGDSPSDSDNGWV